MWHTDRTPQLKKKRLLGVCHKTHRKSAILDQRRIFGRLSEKCNNFSKETPNHTKVGMKEDLQVPGDLMWSNDDIIKATPPEKRKPLFLLGKVACLHSTSFKLCQVTDN
ncbi:hypothetical protein AMECASPLE_003996 [Ameca splendens]|uniref:Uncharacterized protein n=1 Tax=Ameca splendens TaxID=208324 RepID=A0ABV0Z7J7_9TELE